MKFSLHREILDKRIEVLDFSQDFKTLASLMGFETIADIVFAIPDEIIKKANFSYTWLNELIEFLEKHEAAHLLHPITGMN